MFFKRKAEYRKERRVVKKIGVYYKLDNIRVPWKKARTLDISSNGACIVADYRMDEGESLELEIPYKTRGKILIHKVTGRVDWTSHYKGNQFKHGVSFQNKRVHYSQDDHWLRLVSDKHCYFLKNYTQDCLGHVVEDLEQLKSAYQLVYKEYVARKICKPDESKMFYHVYSLIPSTRTFLLSKKEHLLGTVSLVVDSPAGLPMESLYPQEIKALRDQGCIMAEVSMLALNSEHIDKKKYSLIDLRKQAYLFRLFKTMFDYALHAKITDLVIGVHPRHAKLYEYLHFEPIGPAKSYEGACGRPAVLLRLDIDAAIRKSMLLGDFLAQYFLQDALPPEAFGRHFSWSTAAAREFLTRVKSIGHTLHDRQRSYLQNCYPSLKLGV